MKLRIARRRASRPSVDQLPVSVRVVLSRRYLRGTGSVTRAARLEHELVERVGREVDRLGHLHLGLRLLDGPGTLLAGRPVLIRVEMASRPPLTVRAELHRSVLHRPRLRLTIDDA